MELVRPFRALRPDAAHAARVIAPPYDVVTRTEARALVVGNPDHFLHVSRAEIDLPDATDAHDASVYARAAANFARLRADGILRRDAQPGFYVYRLTAGRHVQTGVAVTASVAAYHGNRIRRHELTRPEKETDRVHHIEALNAQTGPVLCVYRDATALTAMIAEAARATPLFAVADGGGVEHALWRVDAAASVAALAKALNALDALYIADGHHRSAAAARVAADRHGAPRAPILPDASAGSPGSALGDASHDYFLTVAFPAAEMRILDYNRVVTDLGGATPAEFLRRVDAVFARRPVAAAYKPDRPQRFGMYFERQWFELQLREPPASRDPVATLDVSLLHERLIEPILGVSDLRRDPRIDFVGGIRGLDALAARVNSGAAVAFSLHPTQIDQLMAVADAGRLMPPKSTWFEPKLADGLIAHVLD